MARRGEHGRDGVTVEPSGAHLGPDLLGGLLGRAGRSVRARLEACVVTVGGRQQTPAGRDRAAGEVQRVAGAVEALMVLGGDLGEWLQAGRRCQHPFGEVRVQPDPLLFGGAELPFLVPYAVRDAEIAEVVDQGGLACQRRVLTGEPERRRRGVDHGGDPAGVAERVRGLDVAEVGDGFERDFQFWAFETAPGRGVATHDRVPH